MSLRLHLRILGPLCIAAALVAPTVSAQCTGDDPGEENDTCGAAELLDEGFTSSLKVYGAGADPDYWLFAAPAGKRTELDIFYDSTAGSLSLDLYDTTGSGCPGVLVDSSATASGIEFVSIDNPTASSYVLVAHVDGGPAAGCVAYGARLEYWNLACSLGDDALEDNDGCSTPSPLPLGLTPDLRVFGSLSALGPDPDWYSYTLQDGDKIFLNRFQTNGSGNLDLRVYDVGATPCPVDNSVDPIAGEYVPFPDSMPAQIHNYSGAPRYLLVEVELFEGYISVPGDCVTYDLSAVVSPSECVTEDAWEPNESCATAPVITVGTYTGLRSRLYETDFYEIVVPAGATLSVDTLFSYAVGNMDLYLWDKAGVCGGPTAGYLDASRTFSDDEDVTWTNTTGTTMEVAIEARFIVQTGTDCVDYDMIVTMTGVPAGVPFCFGDGSDGVACPCGNVPASGFGEGCLNGSGLGAYIADSGVPSISNDGLVLTVNQAVPSEFGIFVQNTGTAAAFAFYNGAICLPVDGHLVRHYAPPAVSPTVTDPGGRGTNAQPMTVGDFLGDTAPGATIYYQFWGRDNSGPCAAGANFSSGLAITWLP